ECRTRGPASVGDASFCSYIRECSITVVAIEDVASETSEVKIGPTVVVEVSDGTAHTEARGLDAGARGDVREGSVMIVVVERSTGVNAFELLLDRRIVGEEDVGPAVAII